MENTIVKPQNPCIICMESFYVCTELCYFSVIAACCWPFYFIDKLTNIKLISVNNRKIDDINDNNKENMV